MRTSLRIAAGLVALLALAGVAAAANAPCPECDRDGEAVDSNYWSVDAGAVTKDAEALADLDAATSHENSEGGFFAWLSICLSAVLEKIGDVVGLDLDANAQAYADSDGADLDATLRVGDRVVDLDDTPAGKADDATWETLAKARGASGQDPRVPNVIPETEDADVDLCTNGELALVRCG
ncbi:MAG TPA: hypothetical protein VM582_09050 [Candidatus Thermoplasmatota archaeon]|nr:hypothetical protein [Candidatus Thermoplasmatota archaeon]